MSEPLHKDEFLLLLLDMGDGAENKNHMKSSIVKSVDDIQTSFDISQNRKGDIMYTLAQSEIVETEPISNQFQKAVYMRNKDEYTEWPFGDTNE